MFLTEFDMIQNNIKEKLEFLKKCSQEEILYIVNTPKKAINTHMTIELELLKRLKDKYPKVRLSLFYKLQNFSGTTEWAKMEFLKECSEEQILYIAKLMDPIGIKGVAIELELLKRLKDKYPTSKLGILERMSTIDNLQSEFLKECSEEQRKYLKNRRREMFLTEFDMIQNNIKEKLEFLKKCSQEEILYIVNTPKKAINTHMTIELELLKRLKDKYPKVRLSLFHKLQNFSGTTEWAKMEFLKECSEEQRKYLSI
jgi:hypothetical protein